MTKRELIEHLKYMKDDDEVLFEEQPYIYKDFELKSFRWTGENNRKGLSIVPTNDIDFT
jgi:hypothetical protein